MAVDRRLVDPRGARFNQGLASALLLIGAVIDQPLLVPATATLLLVGAVLGPRYGPTALFTDIIGLRPGPLPELEDPYPMWFAAAFAGIVLAVSTAAFLAGSIIVGWSLALIIAVMSGLSAITDICVGCMLYRTIRGDRLTRGPDEKVGRARPTEPVAQLSLPIEQDVVRAQPKAPAAQAAGKPKGVKAQPTMPVAQRPERRTPFVGRWRARWVGLRTLGQWVKIVEDTPNGETIVRAGPDRFLLPHGDRRLWPLATCSSCGGEIAGLDVARQQKPVLCPRCTTNLTSRSAPERASPA